MEHTIRSFARRYSRGSLRSCKKELKGVLLQLVWKPTEPDLGFGRFVDITR